MKSLQLGEFTPEGAEKPVTHRDLLVTVVKQPPKEGFDAEEMGSRLSLLKKIKEAEGTLELEDAEAEKVKQLVAAFRWGVADEGLKAFAEGVKAM